MRTTPFAFRSLLQLRFKTDEMVRARTGVTEDYFTSLLADFAVVLVVRLYISHTTYSVHSLTQKKYFTTTCRN